MRTDNVKKSKKIVAFLATVLLVFSVITVGISPIASADLTDDPIDDDGEFEVTINAPDGDDTVTAGEQVDVNWSVENTGDEAGVRNMTFTVLDATDGTEVYEDEHNETETYNLNLSVEETYNYENASYDDFTWTPDEDAVGDYTLNVTAVGYNETADSHTYHEGYEVTIEVIEDDPEEEPGEANFEVEITDYDEDVRPGRYLEIEYTVENTGDAEGTQDIVFIVEGTEEDKNEGLTLDEGETFEGRFFWKAGEGPHLLTVESEDDTARRAINIETVTPGFTSILLILATVFAGAIYYKKKQ